MFQKQSIIVSKETTVRQEAPTLKYILQVNTGSFTHTAADSETIAKRLDACLSMIPVDQVIYGWSADRDVNRGVTQYLSRRGIEKYLWLPIFCEIHDPDDCDPAVSVLGEGNHAIDDLCEGESFDFVCQSSDRNLARAMAVYDELTDGLDVEGVFIDRIRYASAANSVHDLYGCWCPRCMAHYEQAGVNAESIARLSREGGLGAFMPHALENGVYRYENPDIDALMRVKRAMVTRAAEKLCAHFRAKGKKIGIDTFAGGVADFVGQDLHALGGMVDFIKPMAYLKTNAPAGVPFEVKALGGAIEERISKLWAAPAGSLDAAIIQTKELLETGAVVAPGIDANRILPICEATPEYVVEYIDRLEEIGVKSVVLAWDAMRMGEDVLRAIGGRQG